ERRDAAARAKGYASYYDYRAHDNGRLAPSAPRLSGEQLARARGHIGRAAFLRSLDEGDLIIMRESVSSVERDAQGRYKRIVKVVLDAVTGRERRFVLRNLTRLQLVKLIHDEQERGAVFSLSPSLDQ